MIIRRHLWSRLSFSAIFCLSMLCGFDASAQVRVWANDGGDKVTQDELRASNGRNVANSVWNGSTINLFGAKNEVISFNLVIEAASSSVSNVSVQFNQLTGPGGSVISSRSTSGDGVFDWRGRNIELFYVKYLQVKGVSTNTFSNYDERHIPERLRRPWSGPGYGSGTWNDRPDHDKNYPDVAVPLELSPSFSIAARTNQSIWSDIYIPKNAASGNYTGTVTVSVGGSPVSSIPVQLRVRSFALPDTPTAKTMLVYTPYEVNYRYFGTGYVNPLGSQGPQSIQVRQRHFMLAHRHKLSLIDTNYEQVGDSPAPYEWNARLDGSLFTAANGYDGPGAGVGNNIFAIGLYGSWPWKYQDESAMRQHTDNWERWFQANSPATERFLYLDDESHNYSQLEQWSSWIKNNPGPGGNLLSMATVDLPDAVRSVPSLKAPASTFYIGNTSTWSSAQQTCQANSKNRFYLYNGHRPATGTFATEDDGTSPRQIPWAQYKMKIDRWYYWQTTYYNNMQGGTGETNVFRQAQTFGGSPWYDSVKGMTSNGFSNGDGVLFYPGTDRLYSSDSYNVNGPLASLRLKHWRRGIQDVDYLALANAVNPAATRQIMDAVVPKVLWEYGVDDPNDPTWKRTDISWSNNPDVWEQARASLAEIIDGNSTSSGTPTPTPTPTATPGGGSGGVPAAPSNLAAQALVPNQLSLTWNDNSGNESGFKIERSMDGTNFAEVTTTSANTTAYVDSGLNAWTTYAYRIRSINSSGASAYSNYAYRTTLTQNGGGTGGSAPASPSGAGVTSISSSQLNISWTDASSNETGFKIERSINGTTFTEVGTVGANTTSFSDTGLNAWTTYAYRIRAYNASGNSSYSNTAYGTTQTAGSGGGGIPSAPSNLTGSYSGYMQITLRWSDNSSNETGFRIERSTDGVNFSTVTNTSANTNTYVDYSVARWTTYAYRVRSTSSGGASAPSNVTYVSTPP